MAYRRSFRRGRRSSYGRRRRSFGGRRGRVGRLRIGYRL